MRSKWLEDYRSGFKNTYGVRTIGIEKEFPVINRDNLLAFDVRTIFSDLVSMGAEPFYDDFYEDEMLGVTLSDKTVVTTDAGWGTLEIALPPLKSIIEAENFFNEKIDFLKELIGRKGGLILGYGIQPLQPLLASNWVKKRRHAVVCRNFGCKHDVNATVTAGDQVHLSVDQDEVVRATNVFNWLSGLIIAMHANSPVWQGKIDDTRLAVRERMWWFVPDNRHGVFPGPLSGMEDLFARIITMRHLVAKNGVDFFAPKMSFARFLEDNPERQFKNELPALEGTLWYCTRPRSMYGTVEIRPACCQPRESAMALSAFCLGILENLKEAEIFIDSLYYPWDIAREMREIAMTDALNAWIDHLSFQTLASDFLSIASAGLNKRGLGEKRYLIPLEERVFGKKTLSEELIEIFNEKGLSGLVSRVAY